MHWKRTCSLILVLVVGGCVTPSGSVKLDTSAYLVDKGPKEVIPKVCKGLYESTIPKLAIAPFSNNTTFDYAKEIQANVEGSSERQTRGAAAAGAAPGGVGVVWGANEKRRFQKDSRITQREMNAKLSESMEDAVLDQIKDLGGIKVYARKELSKAFDELKFQQSGMVDESTVVKIGKMAGVRYIVTGSFNNIVISYKSFESLRQGSRDVGDSASRRYKGATGLAAMAAGVVASSVAEAAEGWNLEAHVLVRILDVETGEVTFSKQIIGKENIGKVPYPGFSEVVGGVKKAASKEMQGLKVGLSKQFTAKGYIFQTRTSPDGKERVALINLGTNNGINENSQLYVYTFQEIEDPITGNKTCDQSRLPVTLRMTEQIQADKAWVVIDGDAGAVKRVKPGQFVETKPL